MSTQQRNDMNRRKRVKAKKRRGKMVLLVCEVFVLLVAVIALYAVIRTTGNNGIKKYQIEDAEANSDVKQEFEENTELQKYTNIAFFGVDARNGTLAKGTRTDSIMICSINNDTGEVKLCSVYRDTYLNIGNDTYNKCNSAYAKGGPDQAITMLNMNLDMYITDFVTVGFQGLMDTVDALGGVQIDVQSIEISHLNNYQASMYCTEDNPNNYTTNYTPVTESGLQTLNGMQAVAYCRIRYTAGDDYRRTERQRAVLTQILEKAKTASPAALNKIAEDVFPLVATSLDLDEIFQMLGNVTNYNVSDSAGFPFKDSLTSGKIGSKGSCVVPINLTNNVEQLHEFLFPGVPYTVSEDVITYSQRIYSDTSPYVGTNNIGSTPKEQTVDTVIAE